MGGKDSSTGPLSSVDDDGTESVLFAFASGEEWETGLS